MRLAFLFLALLAWSCAETPKPEQENPPNIILILTDDQGWGDLSFNGNTNFQTPNLDAIGQEGAAFENFYVQPVCSPTRAEILTGRQFTKLGVYATSAGGERMNLEETTLPEIFKKAGYSTAAFGKWHNGMQAPYHPNSRGFDEYYGFASGHWGHYFDPLLEHNGALVKGEGYLPDDLTDHALEYIAKNKEGPFFLYLPYNTPHSPMQVPDPYWEVHKDLTLPMRYKDSLEENQNFTRAALAMVKNIDDNVGRIQAKLSELELEENTIVVFLSDNGPNGWRWNGGMRGRKGSTDEGGVRSPLFIKWKDHIPKNKKVNQLGGSIDLLPTLTTLAGIGMETKNPIDGIDLSPYLLEDSAENKNRVLFHDWHGKASVRIPSYRLDDDGNLYNIATDRGQERDISESHPALRDSLVNLRAQWLDADRLSKDTDDRTLPLGYAGITYTQLPARDGEAHGNIIRSNRYPNCSFFTNWTNQDDKITWDIEVMESGTYEVILYYSCASENVGIQLELSHLDSRLPFQITQAHDPPLYGMEEDRDPRIESYVKDFKPLSLGVLELEMGRDDLTLSALNMPGSGGIDVRLLQFIKQ